MSLADAYNRAQEDPSFRTEFLKMVDIGELAKYILGVKYYVYQEFMEAIMTAHPSSRAILGVPNTRSRIMVFPIAFDDRVHPWLDDFLSTLLDYEGEHAKVIFEGNYGIPEAVKEHRCYAAQLQKIDAGLRHVSEAHLHHVGGMLRQYS